MQAFPSAPETSKGFSPCRLCDSLPCDRSFNEHRAGVALRRWVRSPDSTVNRSSRKHARIGLRGLVVVAATLFAIGNPVMQSGAETIVFEDDFSAVKPNWVFTVDMGYVGLPTPQGNLTQGMIDDARSVSYAQVSEGAMHLRANRTAGYDWGVAFGSLNLHLPEDFRILFTMTKTQWAGAFGTRLFEKNPTIYQGYPPSDNGRWIDFGVAGTWVMGLASVDYPYITADTVVAPQRGDHVPGQPYSFEITREGNHLQVYRDSGLLYDFTGPAVGSVRYLGFWCHEAGATAVVDNVRIASLSVPEIGSQGLASVVAVVTGVIGLLEPRRRRRGLAKPGRWGAACAVCTAGFSPAVMDAGMILRDDFDGTTVDTQTWVASPYFSDSVVTVAGGSVFLQNRGRLLSVQGLPQTVQIDGRFRFVGSTHDVFILQTRTDGVTTNPWGEFDVGIRFQASIPNGENGGSNMAITRNAWPGTSYDLARCSFPIAWNTFYDFRVIDTGSLVEFFVGDLSTPLLTATESSVIRSRLGLANREGGAGGSWISNGSVVELDFLQVSSVPELDPRDMASVVAVLGVALSLRERRCGRAAGVRLPHESRAKAGSESPGRGMIGTWPPFHSQGSVAAGV